MTTDTANPVASDRVVHLSAYVDRPLHAVLAALADPDVDSLLSRVAQGTIDRSSGVLVSAHASAPVWVSSTHARIPLSWGTSGVEGAPGTERPSWPC